MTSEDGAGWGTRMVSAYARARAAETRDEALERLVPDARERGRRARRRDDDVARGRQGVDG